jgi:hypothetical protein
MVGFSAQRAAPSWSATASRRRRRLLAGATRDVIALASITTSTCGELYRGSQTALAALVVAVVRCSGDCATALRDVRARRYGAEYGQESLRQKLSRNCNAGGGHTIRNASLLARHACCRYPAATHRPTATTIHASSQSAPIESASATIIAHQGLAARMNSAPARFRQS